MAFDNAKRILTNEDARIASSAEGIYDDDLVVLFWENVEAHHIDECVRYLNSTGQRVVSSGTTFYDVTFDDALHHLHAYYQETDQRIYRVLMRSSITTSSITQSDTKWRLQSGETYEAGTSNLVLAMYNVDPNSIVSLETESLNETYTSIYLLGGTELTGTWFNVARESEYNSQTGLYDLRWYISRYQTKEYIFATKGDQIRNVVDFFKHHMTASAIDDFESNYYFDSATLGDYYYSTDGTNYTKKNDVAATGTLPTTAKNITTEVSGRSVSYEQRPDRENGEVDIFLKLIFNQVLYATANSDLQEYTETVLRTRNASSVDSVGTPADGTQVIIEATVNDDGTFDVVKRTRTYIEQTATSGLSNAFTAESVVITTNASSHAAAPADQADGTIVRSESEQLPNGKFRNIVRTTVARTDVADVTDESTTGNDSGAGFTETTVKKYNQASAETVGADEDAAGTTVIVENTINEDGTFNTIKRTRVEREAQAASGTKGVLSSEAVVITNNAASALAQASSTTAGTTKIHESQQLENGLFRNIQRTITSHANDGSTDKVDQTGSSETILRKYNQATALAHDASEEADGTTITIENTINADGTFNTVKSTRVDSELSATSGAVNNNFSEVRTVTVNAASEAGTPTHEDGKIKINESEKLPNGLFRNVEIVRTFSAIADITDKEIVGTEAVDGGGYTETVTKQYKQSSALAHDTNEDAAGRTITIENTIREDGTFDIIKRVRDERNQEARADSESAASTTVIQIENNAPQELGQLTEALQPGPGVTVTQESIPLDNGLFRNIKTTVTAKSQTALNKTISGKDPHLFFNGYNSYLEFENTQYQQQQKIGTYLIDFEFPEDYKPICIADGLGDFDLNNAEPLSNKVYLFSTIDGEFLGESTIDQDYLRNAVHVYLRTGEISDRNDGVSGDATSEDQLNIYLVIKVRHDEYPQGELSKTVKWNHGQRRIRIAYSADCLGYTSYEFGRRPRFAIENVAGTGTPTAAYNTASDIIIDNTNPGVTIDHVNAKNHTMFPFRVGSGYYGGDSETSGSTDAEQVSLRSEKFLLYSFHYYNCYLEDTDLQAWCDSKTLPAFQPTLSIDPSLGSNVIDSQIKDIALKEEYRQGRTIEAGEPYRIEDLGSGSTAITENSGVNSTSDYQYYPGRAQVIIPESETSNTGDRTSYFIDSASRAGNTITINLSSAHGKTGTWVTTQPNARIVVVGLSGAGGDAGAMTVDPNKKYDSASGGAVTITFTDTDTLTIQDTGISDSGSETYTLKEFRTAVVGSWFKAAVGGSLGNSVIVAPDYIPDTTRFHNATVIGDVFVAGGSREETVEVNTSNTEQKFITDGGTVADPKSGEEKSIVNEVLPDGKYRTTITTRKSKLQSAVSEVSSDSESSTTTINLRNVKQETAEASVPGKIVTVENTPNEDGTFRTSKTITTAKQQASIAGSTNALRSESILIYNNASSTLGAPPDQTDGTIKIHESEELPNGLYRNIIRTIVARNDVGEVDDKTVSGAGGTSAGYVETITKKYNQASEETLSADDKGAGKTSTVENTINEDGTFNTVKTIRTDNQLQATSGSNNALRSESVVITNNASSHLGSPADQNDGTIVIHESEQLPNGLFRNITRTIESKSITDINDGTVSGNGTNAGYTETVLKQYNQTTEAVLSGTDTGVGKTSTVENTLNEDGTFNTIKRIRIDRESTATGGSTNALRSESVVITNNAANPLNAPANQADGTIKIHESEQLPNGLYRNVARTIVARTDFATITDEMSSGSDGNFHAYTETTVKKYNQNSALSYTDGDDAVGRIRKKESIPNEDGTFNTIETTREYQGFSRFYNTKDKHYLIGYHLNPNSTDGFKFTGQSSGTTFAALRTYAAGFKGTFDIVDNDDGTVSYKAVLSKTVENHTLTVRKGGKVTETIEYLRNTTDTAIDNKLNSLSSSSTAGTVVNVQRITGENGSLDAILSKTVTNSSTLSRSYDNGATDIDYEFGFGATSVPGNIGNLDNGKSCVLQASQREDGLFDYVKTTTTVTNYSRQFSLRNQIILLGHHVSTTDNAGFKTPDNPNGTTFTNFKAYISGKDAQLELKENDDNTISYIVRINSAVAEEYVTPLAGDNEISTRIIVKENQASFPDQKDIAESVEIDINGDFTNTSGTVNRADTWSTPVEDTSTAGIYFTDAGTVRLRDTRTNGVNNTVDAYLKKDDGYLDAGREYRFTYTVTEFNDASGETSNLRFQYNEAGLDGNIDDGVTGVTGFGSNHNSVDMNKEVGTHSFTFTVGGTGGVPFNIYHSNGSDTKNSYIVLKDLILEQLSHLNETDGSTFTTRSLTGPSGSGTPVINPDGTYSYAIVSETRTVSKIAGVKGSTDGTDFYLKSMGRRTERNAALRSTSFQQIERRIGGELEFNRDDQGNLSGVNWSASWDAGTNANGGASSYPTSIPPDDWFSAGYQARYGAWKDRYVKTYLTGPGSLVAPTHPTSTCKGVYRADAIYQIGDVVYNTTNTRFEIATGGQNAWSGSSQEYAVGQSVTSGNLIYTVTDTVNLNNVGNREVTPQSQIGISDLYVIGALGSTITWTEHDASNIIQKIGIAETGVSVFKDVDYYISILKEVSREVKWNEEWEWTSGTTYNNNDVVFFLPTQKRYKGKNTPGQNSPTSGGNSKWTELDDDATDAPKGWSTYAGQYGTWQGRFTKAYKVGPNSLPDSNLTNTGFWTGTRVYKVGEVASFGSSTTSRENPLFKILTTSNTSAYSPGSDYTAGDLVIQGGKLFKCIASHNNSDKDPVRESGIGIWQEGATGTELGGSGSNKWSSIGNTEVEAVIGLRGAGAEPFEAPAKVGVLDGSGGFAASPSSRLAFYTNAGLNPRLCEIYEATKRDELTIVLRTYFAVNPDYLNDDKKRVTVDYTNQDNIKTLITDHISTSTGTNKLRVPSEFSLNADHSNYEILFDRGKEGPFYIIDMRIIIRTPFEKDLEGLTDIKNRLSDSSHGKIVDDKVIVYRDLTHANKPWDTNLLSL